MSRERALIKRATEALKYWIDATSHSVDWELLEDLESYLSIPEPEQDEEPEKYGPGMIGFIQYIPDAGMSFTLDEPDDDSYPFEPVYTHPAPRPEFVKLSEEEIIGIVRADSDFDEMMWDDTSIRFARAIEDALEEKNK